MLITIIFYKFNYRLLWLKCDKRWSLLNDSKNNNYLHKSNNYNERTTIGNALV